jgi:hypothetical protein
VFGTLSIQWGQKWQNNPSIIHQQNKGLLAVKETDGNSSRVYRDDGSECTVLL